MTTREAVDWFFKEGYNAVLIRSLIGQEDVFDADVERIQRDEVRRIFELRPPKENFRGKWKGINSMLSDGAFKLKTQPKLELFVEQRFEAQRLRGEFAEERETAEEQRAFLRDARRSREEFGGITAQIVSKFLRDKPKSKTKEKAELEAIASLSKIIEGEI